MSVTACALALVLIVVKGLNYGIDFKGGTEVQLKFKKDVGEESVRKAMKELPDLALEKTQVQSFGDPKEHEFLVKIEQVSFLSNDMLAKLCKAVSDRYGKDRVKRCKRTAEGVDVVEVRLTPVTGANIPKKKADDEKVDTNTDKQSDEKEPAKADAEKQASDAGKKAEAKKSADEKDDDAAQSKTGPKQKKENTSQDTEKTNASKQVSEQSGKTSKNEPETVTKDDMLKVLQAVGMEHFQVFRMGKKEKQEFRVVFQGLAKQIEQGLEKKFGQGNVKVIRVDAVGAKVGKKLRNDGILAILYALIGILIYIGLRFDLKFAPGAVICLMHDVLITVGLFSLLNKEFTLSIIAALLTIVGYSLNDTIVVFDRIRENMAKLRGSSLPDITNKSINETLSRTLLTSLTTLITVAALFVYGGGIIHDFAFAMLVGVIVGTYSSIFVASPIMLYLNKMAEQRSGRR
ncbi:MAG: protein translocase subunit SecF [Deltaproteobacteria bacterium]|nr:protein translocase subunit SecF [Deltaproteobacteria bacterium]